MKPVIIGVVVAVVIIFAFAATAGFFLGWFSLGKRISSGGSPSPSPSSSSPPSQPSPSSTAPLPTVTPSTTSPKTTTVPSTPSTTPTSTSSTTPTANVDFELVVTNVSGTGLSRTVTAQITNTGTTDAHNVWVKVELSSQGQRVLISGQDYLRVDIGTIKAKATVTAQTTLSISVFDGLKIQANGAQFVLTIYSDERTQKLAYDYRP